VKVSEFGWGEFEAGIRIFFRDADEQPIDLIHQIKLYPQAPEGVDPLSATAPPPQNSKKPVVSEQYDEAVFTDPTESFRRLLMLYSVCQTDLRGADSVAMVRP
jgi:YEATS domain-containing protein 4